MPSKFGELLLRMPELQRVCQVILKIFLGGRYFNRTSSKNYIETLILGLAYLHLCWTKLISLPPTQVGKEMLCLSQQPREEDGDAPGFNFLMELLRGDH